MPGKQIGTAIDGIAWCTNYKIIKAIAIHIAHAGNRRSKIAAERCAVKSMQQVAVDSGEHIRSAHHLETQIFGSERANDDVIETIVVHISSPTHRITKIIERRCAIKTVDHGACRAGKNISRAGVIEAIRIGVETTHNKIRKAVAIDVACSGHRFPRRITSQQTAKSKQLNTAHTGIHISGTSIISPTRICPRCAGNQIWQAIAIHVAGHSHRITKVIVGGRAIKAVLQSPGAALRDQRRCHTRQRQQ